MDKVMELLEQLANSLGVAVEYLWSTLVRQQYVEGVTNLVMVAIGIIVMIVLLCYTPKATRFFTNQYKESAEDRMENGTGYNGSHYVSSYKEDFCNFLRFAVPIVGFVAIFIIVLCVINDIKYGIQLLLNPDYFALKEVLDAISGS